MNLFTRAGAALLVFAQNLLDKAARAGSLVVETVPAIDKTTVKKAEAGDRPLYIWDYEIKGYALHVLRSGAIGAGSPRCASTD